jgi:hypothetical protein
MYFTHVHNITRFSCRAKSICFTSVVSGICDVLYAARIKKEKFLLDEICSASSTLKFNLSSNGFYFYTTF